jgi:microcystin-dependent protein
MYSLYADNRNDCYKLIPHFDENCDYYISPNLHVENYIKCNFANIYANIQIDGFTTIYKDLTLFGNLNLIHGNVIDYNSEVKVSDSMIITGDAINDSLVVCQNSAIKEIAVFKNSTSNVLVISPNYETSITGNTNISGNINVQGNIVISSPSRIRNSVGNIDPSIGDIKMSVRNSDFDGWILCDGRSLSTVTYSTLFSLIGYTYGGSGGTFYLPNSAGQTLGSAGGAYPFGTYTGTATNTLITANLPAHTHSGSTSTVGSHTHNYNDAYFSENVGGGSNYGTSAGTDTDNAFIWRTASGGWSTSPSDIATSGAGSHNHSFTTDNGTGSSTAFSIMQPTLFIGYTFIYGGV